MCPLQGLLFPLTLSPWCPPCPTPPFRNSFTNMWEQCCFSSSGCPLKFDSIQPNRVHQTLGITYRLTHFIILSGTTGWKCGWWVSILTAPWHVMPGWWFLKIIKLRKDNSTEGFAWGHNTVTPAPPPPQLPPLLPPFSLFCALSKHPLWFLLLQSQSKWGHAERELALKW